MNMEMENMKTIVLTGGGTAGHVTPNIALFDALKEKDYNIVYIGSKDGMEKELIEKLGIEYHGISSGKLRRYFDKKNFTDTINVIKGISEATKLIKKIKPVLIFSKGGFVTVPVVIAAKRNKIPIIIHESDITPGLANKIAIPFSTTVCTAFPESLNHIPKNKAVLTGTPIRKQLFEGKAEKGLSICGFSKNKPVLLVMGGSLGSIKINTVVRECLNELLKKYNIIHICGKGNLSTPLLYTKGYKQFEYISKELPDIFACSTMVVSRAGANSIYEFLALKKPMLLIPLSKAASRGDQILNANSFSNQGFGMVMEEENLTKESLIENINSLYNQRNKIISAMNNTNLSNGVEEVVKQITKLI